MKLIVGKRQTGKTIEAIMTSHATGATILCANEARKRFTKQEAERLQRSIPDPLTIADLRKYGRPVRPILIIDDLEGILEGILERDLECQVIAAFMSVTNILEPIEEEQERGMKTNTHIVIKIEDIFKYLTDNQIKNLDAVLNTIENGRKKDGKKTNNSYYICNTDEPYADKVLEIILKAESEVIK